MDGPNNGIILYHYSFSPYARRVIWYLALRGIDFAQCLQPPVLPRPDVKALGIKYRRIPLMSIGRDVYCDTRLILRKLEELFPRGAIGASQPEHKALQKLLEIWTIDSGVFNRASQLIPTSLPLMNDPTFTKDRQDYSGQSWEKSKIEARRPEALAHFRNTFHFLETTLLSDGREWILKTEKPSLGDIEGLWSIDWLIGLKGALPPALFSEKQYPKVFAWHKRFRKAVKTAQAAVAKPTTLKGDVALQRILDARFAEQESAVDEEDPLGLKKGTEVEVWPIDTGVRHRDRGRVVGLTQDEVVLTVPSEAQGKEIRVHFPRTNFRIEAVKEGATVPKL